MPRGVPPVQTQQRVPVLHVWKIISLNKILVRKSACQVSMGIHLVGNVCHVIQTARLAVTNQRFALPVN